MFQFNWLCKFESSLNDCLLCMHSLQLNFYILDPFRLSASTSYSCQYIQLFLLYHNYLPCMFIYTLAYSKIILTQFNRLDRRNAGFIFGFSEAILNLSIFLFEKGKRSLWIFKFFKILTKGMAYLISLLHLMLRCNSDSKCKSL